MIVNIPTSHFEVVKAAFYVGAEGSIIDVDQAFKIISSARVADDDNVVRLDFPTREDRNAFVACVMIGGESSPMISDEDWKTIIVPLIPQ